MMSYLWERQILLKEFKDWAMGLTDAVKRSTTQLAERSGRPLRHLLSSATRKEDEALAIARQDGVTEGLVCVLTCTESCQTFEVGPNADERKLELRVKPGRCRHDYFYVLDRQYGLMHLRLQTWLPFSIHVCLNGREWLANLLRKHGIGFEQRDNCFVDLERPARAQTLCDRQQRTDWNALLNRLVRRWHPAHRTLFPDPLDYYWSAEETEWATDVMFRSPEALAELYPHFLRHAAYNLDSAEVMRYFGRKLTLQGRPFGNFQGEVVSDVAKRADHFRSKHRINKNWIKMYDKQDSVLRIETTLNDAKDMKVFRRAEGNPDGPKRNRILRKSVADTRRRAQICQSANARYLDSLAQVHATQSLGELTQGICRPTELGGKRVRALQPWSPEDTKLLDAVNRPEFALNGFRNRDLRPLWFGPAEVSAEEQRRQSAKISRLLRLLRAHGLLFRVQKTFRYQLTSRGRTILTALQAARAANPDQLAKLAG
jgi:hypothetical protein